MNWASYLRNSQLIENIALSQYVNVLNEMRYGTSFIDLNFLKQVDPFDLLLAAFLARKVEYFDALLSKIDEFGIS